MSLFTTLLISAYVLCKLKLKPLIIFGFLSVFPGVCVEYLNTEAQNWVYFNSGQPPLFVAIGWVFLLAIIFYASGFLKKYVNWQIHPMIPSLTCFVLFFLLSYMERNITFLTIGLYLFMAALGLYASYSETFGWNITILLVGIIVESCIFFCCLPGFILKIKYLKH